MDPKEKKTRRVDIDLGKRFDAACREMKNRGISGKQIAEEMGIHLNTVSKFRHGRIPSDALLELFQRLYGIRREWLETGKGPMMWEEPESVEAYKKAMAVLENYPLSESITFEERKWVEMLRVMHLENAAGEVLQFMSMAFLKLIKK